ncbi:MAG: cytochrome P450 [Chitinophagales bacterium]
MNYSKKLPQISFLKSLYRIKDFAANPIPMINNSMKRYGDTYATYIGPMRMIVTQDPAHIQYILQQNHKNYHKSKIIKTLAKQIGNGLLTTDGSYWLRQRRLIQPGFHRQKLQALVSIMQQETQQFITELKGYAQTGEVIDLSKEMMKITLRIVAKSLFSTGITSKDLELIDHVITEQQKYIITKVRQPYLKPWLFVSGEDYRQKKISEQLDQLLQNIINQRKSSNEEHDDLLDMLLSARYEDTGEGMDNQQLRDESLILFVAGHETSANALAWTWYLLSQNQDIEAKILKETENVLGNRLVSFEDIPQLQYTKQVLQETMRLYPPAWIMDRVALSDDKLGEFDVPKGQVISLFIYGAHRNPNYWDNPEHFDPDRFTKEAMKERPAFSYFPFGGGPRLCIGQQFAYMEMQLVVAEMIRKFRIELVENQDIDILPLITLRPKNGILARLKERNKG